MDEAHLFLDTNVLLHYQALDAIKWREIVSAKRVFLHLAQSVLEEIAIKKDMGESKRLRKRAGSVAKRLLECLETANPFCIRPDEFLLLESETPKMERFPALNPASNDDKLVASALTFSQASASNCFVVTGDSSLTLRVKLKQWNLKHISAPEPHKLPDEPDAEERARMEIQKELAKLKKEQPELALTFLNGETFLRVPQPSDIEPHVQETMTKLRSDKKPISTLGRVILGASSAFGTPEEIDEYNGALEDFFSQYEAWLRAVHAIKQKIVDIKLKVFNRGAVPAESVHISLRFPDGFKLVKRKEVSKYFPKPPNEPTKPGIEGILPAGLRSAEMFTPTFHMPTAPVKESISIIKTNSYDVVWERQKLRQNTSEPLDEMAAIFTSQLRSFEITFELRADNLRAVVPGKLHVIAP
jgi:hypothetical protein